MGLIPPLEGPLLWGTELSTTPEEYTLDLNESDRAEIKAALDRFKSQILGLRDVSPATFPLPNLEGRLMKASEELHYGKGFFMVTGLNIDKFTPEEATLVYLGLTSYIGDKQGLQNKDGDVMVHVTDAKHWTVPESKRHGIHSKNSLPFHNDMGAEILSLQAREGAKVGGNTYLASAWAIHNDLASRQPGALDQLLSHTWPVQTSGEGMYFLAPLMQVHDKKLITSVDPARLGPHPEYTPLEGQTRVPELSSEQQAALRALDESAKRNEISVSLQKGGMLFLNNWAILHRRGSYEDGEKTSRHLVRLWTRNTKLGWAIPEEMAQPWRVAYDYEGKKAYSVDPPKEYKVPKYTAGSAAFGIEEGKA